MSANTLSRLLDEDRLQPLLDAVAGVTDGAWRRAFVAQIDPRPEDVIVEIGCGDGAMTVLLAAAAPGARLIAVDPDAAALSRAEARAQEAGVEAHFIRGLARDIAHLTAAWAPTKVVGSFSLQTAAMHEQSLILRAAHEALRADGALHLVEHCAQKAPLVQRLFHLFQGVERSEDAALPRLMREAGFKAVDETQSFATLTGAITLYSARAN